MTRGRWRIRNFIEPIIMIRIVVIRIRMIGSLIEVR